MPLVARPVASESQTAPADPRPRVTLRVRLVTAASAILLALASPAAGEASLGPPQFGSGTTIDGAAAGTPVAGGVSCAAAPPSALCMAVGGSMTVGGLAAVATEPDARQPGWSTTAVTTPNSPTGPNLPGPLLGVSCPTISLCVSVDYAAAVVSTDPGSSAPTWTSTPVPNPATVQDYVRGVSCTASAVCGIWTNPTSRRSNPNNGAAYVGGVAASGAVSWVQVAGGFVATGMSCTDAGGCVGIGGSGQVDSVAGTSTTSPQWAAPTTIDAGHILTAISCAEGATCVAVDDAGAAFVSTDDSGTAWSVATSIDVAALSSVSCTTVADTCVAVDRSGNQVVFTVNPASGSVTADAPRPVLSGLSASLLVSCATAGPCAIVAGGARAETSADVGRATGPTWSAPALVDGTESLSGVSCETVGGCAAVDGNGNAVLSIAGPSRAPAWLPARAIDPGYALRSVSCAAGGAACVAVDGDGRAVVSTDPGSAAPTWSSPFAIDPGRSLSGVSCDAAATLCVAVDDSGGAVITDTPATPGSWARATIDGARDLTGVSCPIVGLCAAVDGSGSVLVSTTAAPGVSTGWTAFPVDPGAALSGISCTSKAVCVAVDRAGAAVASANVASATPTWSSASLAIDPGHVLTGVSCTSDGSCVATDASGQAVFSAAAAATSPAWSPVTGIPAGAPPLSGVSCDDDGVCVLAGGANGLAFVGQRLAAAVSVAPGFAQFPTTRTGSRSAPMTFTLANTGGGTLNVSGVSLAGADASQFVLADHGCTGAAIPPQASCTVNVAFAPTRTASAVAARLEFGSDALSSPDDLTLSGIATASAVSITPALGALPDTQVGSMSAAQPFEVTNAGTATLNISAATLTGTAATEFAVTGNSCGGAALASGASCFVDVAFVPTSAGLPGRASLEILSDSPSSPDGVALSGTATQAVSSTPALSVSPAATFADTVAGSTSATRTLLVSNTGTGTLRIASVGLVGRDAPQYTVADRGCGGSALAPGATCSIEVGFVPTTPGTFSGASVEIRSDAPSSPDEVGLSGIGVSRPAAQPPPPVAQAAPVSRPAATARAPTAAPPSNVFTLIAPKTRLGGVVVVAFKLPGAGKFSVQTTAKVPVAALPKQPVSKSRTIAFSPTVSHPTKRSTTVTLTIRPGRVAAAELKKHRKLRVAITIRFTPAGGRPASRTFDVTVKSA